MKYNVIINYVDCVDNGGCIYDCWAKDVWQLYKKGEDYIWNKYKTKVNKNFLKQGENVICFGDRYGYISIYRDNLFPFDEEDIEKLNFFHKKDDMTNINKLIKELNLQLRKKITDQLMLLEKSGLALISTAYPHYPIFDGAKYISKTRLGIAFSKFADKKEANENAYIREEGFAWQPNGVILT